MKTDTLRILLMEDDPGDVELITEALRESSLPLAIAHVENGEEGMRYLRQETPYDTVGRPDLVLLDLNMPRMDGHEVLEAVKGDKALRAIPVIILTTSDAETDIVSSYDQGANCYLQKPMGLSDFVTMVKRVEEFWFNLAKLPPKSGVPGGT